MVITSPVRAEARLGWTSVALALRLIVAVLPGIGAGLAPAFAHASNDSSADRHPAENSSGRRVDQVVDDVEQLPRAAHSPRVNLAHQADEWTTTALVSAPHRDPDRPGPARPSPGSWSAPSNTSPSATRSNARTSPVGAADQARLKPYQPRPGRRSAEFGAPRDQCGPLHGHRTLSRRIFPLQCSFGR